MKFRDQKNTQTNNQGYVRAEHKGISLNLTSIGIPSILSDIWPQTILSQRTNLLKKKWYERIRSPKNGQESQLEGFRRMKGGKKTGPLQHI